MEALLSDQREQHNVYIRRTQADATKANAEIDKVYMYVCMYVFLCHSDFSPINTFHTQSHTYTYTHIYIMHTHTHTQLLRAMSTRDAVISGLRGDVDNRIKNRLMKDASVQQEVTLLKEYVYAYTYIYVHTYTHIHIYIQSLEIKPISV